MDQRLQAVCDLRVAESREYAGLHGYDGVLQDLSPSGVAAGLARLGGPDLDDSYDEAHLRAFEELTRVTFAEAELHRRDPLTHVGNLDLSCYDRDYAPEPQRAAARQQHLAGWPDAVDAALESLDMIAAPTAAALIGAVRGLAARLDREDTPQARAALAAHARLVAHVERAAAEGHPDASLGAPLLRRLLGSGEALDVDLDAMSAQADSERDRLRALLDEGCQRIAPGQSTRDTVRALVADHPDADGVLAEARAQVEEVMAFTAERNLVPYLDGECLVGPAPESRRWSMAMMSWAAPEEDEGPSWYYITPPDPAWPAEEQQEWLAVFSRTTLPGITAHEVAPGHFSHGRALRHAPTQVRRTLQSMVFAEGWAHHTEELFVEEGFRADDPRFAVGMAIEALIRVTRLAAAIGIHTATMSVDEAAQRFAEDAHLQGPAARSEAMRGTFDPTYGRYTWGKLAIRDLREQARRQWGAAYSHLRFHSALLELGSPPLGLMGTALERG
ncbi:MAG: hypothetical protein NVSMB13_19710 [Mycobacteriales bacterium]